MTYDRKATDRRYYVRNRKRIDEAKRLWRIENLPDYWKEYYQRTKATKAPYKKAWALKNLKRVRAHCRLRYLASKEVLSEGEMEQVREIARIYPKRR